MATPPNKPRDIKNLKARLGKPGGPGSQPGVSAPPAGAPLSTPPAASPFGSAPPASSPFGTPAASAPSGASLPAPPRASVPPVGVKPVAMPGGIVAPPFVKPAVQPSAAPAAAAAPVGSASPFDRAAPVAVERKVTLVIDDSAVKDDEIGRKTRSRNMTLLAIGSALGLVFGYAVGSTGSENTQYNLAVADGKEIYKRVNEVSALLDQAKAKVKAIVGASQGGPGRQATIDYKSIEALVAMPKPIVDNEFHGRRYKAFPQNVVNDLFDYYNNINLLWNRITTLGAKTAGGNKRRVLDESAKAADEMLDFQYGMVLTKVEDNFAGGLVVVRPPEAGAQPADGEKKEDDGAPKLLVSSREGGREVERTVFQGQTDIGEKYDNYVFMLDKARSMGILGARASMFGEFRGDLTTTQALMDSTIEIQGRLLQDLGKVAGLKERTFLFF